MAERLWSVMLVVAAVAVPPSAEGAALEPVAPLATPARVLPEPPPLDANGPAMGRVLEHGERFAQTAENCSHVCAESQAASEAGWKLDVQAMAVMKDFANRTAKLKYGCYRDEAARLRVTKQKLYESHEDFSAVRLLVLRRC